MRVTDWNKITISAKEFLAGIVFAVSMSGVYYKVYFQQAEETKTNEAFRTEVHIWIKEHDEKSDARFNLIDSRFRTLEDDNLRRKILDEGHSSNGYAPMQRVK